MSNRLGYEDGFRLGMVVGKRLGFQAGYLLGTMLGAGVILLIWWLVG